MLDRLKKASVAKASAKRRCGKHLPILPTTLRSIRILNRLPFPRLSSSLCSIAQKNKMALTDKALDSIGVAQVRANLATNVYLGNDRAIVVGWLARRDEASIAEQLNLSRSA